MLGRLLYSVLLVPLFYIVLCRQRNRSEIETARDKTYRPEELYTFIFRGKFVRKSKIPLIILAVRYVSLSLS